MVWCQYNGFQEKRAFIFAKISQVLMARKKDCSSWWRLLAFTDAFCSQYSRSNFGNKTANLENLITVKDSHNCQGSNIHNKVHNYINDKGFIHCTWVWWLAYRLTWWNWQPGQIQNKLNIVLDTSFEEHLAGHALSLATALRGRWQVLSSSHKSRGRKQGNNLRLSSQVHVVQKREQARLVYRASSL